MENIKSYARGVILNGTPIENIYFQYDVNGNMVQESIDKLYKHMANADCIIYAISNAYDDSVDVAEVTSVNELLNICKENNNVVYIYGTRQSNTLFTYEPVEINISTLHKIIEYKNNLKEMK